MEERFFRTVRLREQGALDLIFTACRNRKDCQGVDSGAKREKELQGDSQYSK